MDITEVKVFLVNEEKLKAFVTITLDNCFIVRDLKIIKGKNGLFVAMPSKKRKDGAFRDIAHPLDNETRQMLEKKVIEKYNEVAASSESESVASQAEDESYELDADKS